MNKKVPDITESVEELTSLLKGTTVYLINRFPDLLQKIISSS